MEDASLGCGCLIGALKKFKDTKKGEGKACWDCHTDVPHTKVSNISSSPNSLAPMPKSPVPNWLKNSIK